MRTAGEMNMMSKFHYVKNFLTQLIYKSQPFRLLTVFLILCVQTPPLHAQNATSSVEKWKMTYKDLNGYTELYGIAVRSGTKVQLGWEFSQEDPALYDNVRSIIPNWREAITQTQTDQEIIFKTKELSSNTSSDKAIMYVDGQITTVENWSKLWADPALISQRNALRVLILGLHGIASETGIKSAFGKQTGVLNGPKLHGLKLRLFNPRVSEGGRNIKWDWESQIGFDEKITNIEKASGSKDEGNPIIWGELPNIDQIFVFNAQEVIIKSKNTDADEGNKDVALYPWLDEKGALKSTQPPQAFKREIVIAGTDLDQFIGSRPQSQLSTLSYEEIRNGGLVTARQRVQEIGQTNALDSDQVDELRAYIAANEDKDIVAVTVNIDARTDAQIAGFTIEDLNGEWPLLFGDHKGNIVILRTNVPGQDDFGKQVRVIHTKTSDNKKPTATNEERAEQVLYRDQIVFEATFDHIPESKPVRIALEGGSEQDGIGGNRAKELILSPVINDPKRFRSEPYILVNPKTYSFGADKADGGEDNYADVSDEMAFAWTKDNFVRPRLIDLPTGTPLGDVEVIGGDRFVEGEYINALRRAHVCYEFPLSDEEWSKLTIKQEQDIAVKKAREEMRGYWWSKTKFELSIGRHAAAILLRDEYLQLIEPYRLALAPFAIGNEQAKYVEAATIAMWKGVPTPLSAFELPNGITLEQFMADLKTENVSFRSSNSNRINPQIRDAVEGAIFAQYNALEDSIRIARSINNCSATEFLNFVGFGFRPIVDKLIERVSRLETDPATKIKTRRPDVVARRELDSIYISQNLADAIDKAGNAEIQVVKLTGTAISIATGFYAAKYGIGALAALSAAIESGDFIYTLNSNIDGYELDQKNLVFAKGASTILGKQYLRQVEAKTQGLGMRIVDVVGSGLGLLVSADELVRIGLKPSLVTKNLTEVLQNSDGLSAVTRTTADPDAIKRARDFWSNPSGVGANRYRELEDPQTRAALSEFLGTPEKLLGSDETIELRREMRRIFATSQQNFDPTKFSEIPKSIKLAPDMLDAVNAAGEKN